MARTHRNPEAPDQVVEAARRVIAVWGLRGATVRAIASEVGASTGTVTHYFESKQHLAMAALDRNNALAGGRVLRRSGSKRGVAAIAAAVEALLPIDDERRLEWAVWIAFWTASATDEDAASAIGGARQALAAMLARPFAEAIADGELPEALDVAYETERLLVLASGIGLLVNGRGQSEMRRLARRMVDDHLAELAHARASIS